MEKKDIAHSKLVIDFRSFRRSGRKSLSMNPEFFRRRWRFSLAVLTCALSAASVSVFVHVPQAQTNRPVLISQETSTRAIAVDSVTRTHEPFATTTEVSWGNDNRTRVMLFAMGLNLQPNETAGDVTAEAEDGAHKTYPLVVEY